MGTRKPKEVYIQKACTTTIKATSRAGIKVNTKSGDTFYTMEYAEERVIPDIEGVNLEEERKLLWATVNTECDKQVESVLVTYRI